MLAFEKSKEHSLEDFGRHVPCLIVNHLIQLEPQVVKNAVIEIQAVDLFNHVHPCFDFRVDPGLIHLVASDVHDGLDVLIDHLRA
jgi:hypothetical protein